MSISGQVRTKRIIQLLFLFDSLTAFCLEPNDESTVEITRTANLSDICDREIDIRLTGQRSNQSITIYHFQRRFRSTTTHPTAYCFHAWCYEILAQKVERCTESEIYKLSQILSLDSVIWESRHLHRQQIEPTSIGTLRELADRHQPLDKLLRLPVELRNMVWKHIGLKAAFSATVLVAEETTRLLYALNCPDCRTISLTPGSRISVKMMTVFGTSYIQSLAEGDCSEIIPGVIIYLKFAMVYGGICAVQLYGSGWKTSWLGVLPKSGCTWYGYIRKPGNTLACVSNVSRHRLIFAIPDSRRVCTSPLCLALMARFCGINQTSRIPSVTQTGNYSTSKETLFALVSRLEFDNQNVLDTYLY